MGGVVDVWGFSRMKRENTQGAKDGEDPPGRRDSGESSAVLNVWSICIGIIWYEVFIQGSVPVRSECFATVFSVFSPQPSSSKSPRFLFEVCLFVCCLSCSVRCCFFFRVITQTRVIVTLLACALYRKVTYTYKPWKILSNTSKYIDIPCVYV